MTTIDFGKLMQEAGEGFKPIPDGPYNIEVAKAEPTTSSTNKPMIRVQHRIIGGPHAGRLLFDQFVISAGNPNALSFFFEHMAAFGLGRDYFAANPPLEQVAQTLLGRQALVSVGTKNFKGSDRNEVTAYNAPSMGQVGGGAPVTAPAGPGPAPVPQAPIPQAPAPPVPQAPPAAPAPAPAPQAPPQAPPQPPPGVVQQPPAVAPPAPPVAPPQAAPAVPPPPAQVTAPQAPVQAPAPAPAPPQPPTAPPTVAAPAVAAPAPPQPPTAPPVAEPAPVPAPPQEAPPVAPPQPPAAAYNPADEEPY